MTATATFKISPYIGYLSTGSDISNPDTDSGYDRDLAVQLRRVGSRGGTITVSARGLRDLAEWLEAMQIAESDSRNISGARSCATHIDRALLAAAAIENPA